MTKANGNVPFVIWTSFKVELVALVVRVLVTVSVNVSRSIGFIFPAFDSASFAALVKPHPL